MKTVFFITVSAFCSLLLIAESAVSQTVSLPLTVTSAVWENDSRFYEFTSDGLFRIVLKPYYGFVYESMNSLSWELLPVSNSGDCLIQIQYPDSSAVIPVLICKNGLYLNYFVCTNPETPVSTDGINSSNDSHFINGFWQQNGNRDRIRLYDELPYNEIFCWYFHNNSFCLIRYWKTDLEFREAHCVIFDTDGTQHNIPRFLQKDGVVYSCVTLNEMTVRHYMRGRYQYDTKRSAIVLNPSESMLPKDPRISHCSFFRELQYSADSTLLLPAIRTAGGLIFAPGIPDAVAHDFGMQQDNTVDQLDQLISYHNALRRPPRMPFFKLMELDFHWDEITVLSKSELESIRKYLSEFSVPWISD